MKTEIQNKVRACKALQGKSVADIVNTERFFYNLKAYFDAQLEDRNATKASFQAMKKAGMMGYKIPSHPIDKVTGMGPEGLRQEYLRILTGKSELPFSQRQYIGQLAGQAYSLTVAQYVIEEFPELEDVLIPKSKAN